MASMIGTRIFHIHQPMTARRIIPSEMPRLKSTPSSVILFTAIPGWRAISRKTYEPVLLRA